MAHTKHEISNRYRSSTSQKSCNEYTAAIYDDIDWLYIGLNQYTRDSLKAIFFLHKYV